MDDEASNVINANATYTIISTEFLESMVWNDLVLALVPHSKLNLRKIVNGLNSYLGSFLVLESSLQSADFIFSKLNLEYFAMEGNFAK